MFILRGKAHRNAGRIGHDIACCHAAVGRRLGHRRIQQRERPRQCEAFERCAGKLEFAAVGACVGVGDRELRGHRIEGEELFVGRVVEEAGDVDAQPLVQRVAPHADLIRPCRRRTEHRTGDTSGGVLIEERKSPRLLAAGDGSVGRKVRCDVVAEAAAAGHEVGRDRAVLAEIRQSRCAARIATEDAVEVL